jgi:ketosteroid isomerase-like protein
MANDGVGVVRDYLDAWVDGDVEKGTSFYADDIVCHLGGRSPVSGTYRGKQEFREGYVNRVLEITEGKWTVTGYQDIAASDERVYVVVNERFERAGHEPVEGERVAIYDVNEAGKIRTMWAYDTDSYAVDQLLS